MVQLRRKLWPVCPRCKRANLSLRIDDRLVVLALSAVIDLSGVPGDVVKRVVEVVADGVVCNKCVLKGLWMDRDG